MKPLVLVEWLDSAQPVPGWRSCDDLPPLEVIRCQSVGWRLDKNEQVLMLAPNLGRADSDEPQGCGFMRIPTASVTRTVALREAENTP